MIKSLALPRFTLVCVCCLFMYGSRAQSGITGTVYDSTVIPKKRMNQQNEFWNYTTNFPAKPRNMWEIGASIGMFNISGDVTVKPFTFPSFEAHIRKAFGYVFSVRLQYLNAIGRGLDYHASGNFLKNPAWNINLPAGNRYFAPDALYNLPGSGITVNTDHAGNIGEKNMVYYNYQTRLQDIGLQGIITLNNIRFHKQRTGFVLYAGAGAGVTVFKTMVNALDAAGTGYKPLFNNVFTKYGEGTYKQRKDILNDLKAGMDKTFETNAEAEGSRRPVFGKDKTLKPSGTVLAGLAIKLGKRINLAIEDRFTFIKTDLLDGQRWQEEPLGDAALTSDFDTYNFASVGLNINLGGKAVQPLWWINPLDYAYDELRNHRILKIPNSDCNDFDGDGVCDHLDREPNTPAGCPVDTHGITLDTDGDGVPDCKDKQMMTPSECQPVNADGVGKCADPECCKFAASGTDIDEKLNGFPWPPPAATARSNALRFNTNNLNKLNDVKEFLQRGLANYQAFQYYSVPGGFTLVTPLEQIESNGVPKKDPPRWTIKTDLAQDFSIMKYLSALFMGNKGYYRVLVFMVTNQVPSFNNNRSGQTILNLPGGKPDLPLEIGEQRWTPEHRCYILIYEFEQKKSGTKPLFVKPGMSSISFNKHFANTPEINRLFIR